MYILSVILCRVSASASASASASTIQQARCLDTRSLAGQFRVRGTQPLRPKGSSWGCHGDGRGLRSAITSSSYSFF